MPETPVEMTYAGKKRTVRVGPRTYDMSRGTFEAHPSDVTALESVGASRKAATAADDTPKEGDR